MLGAKLLFHQLARRFISNGHKAPVGKNFVGFFACVLRYPQKAIPTLTDIYKFIVVVQEVDSRAGALQRTFRERQVVVVTIHRGPVMFGGG
jgi:hypothetical protein